MQLRQREVQNGSQLVAQWADAFLKGHGPSHEAGGSPEYWITVNGQKELPLAQSVEDTSGVFFIGFTGPVWHRLAIVPHRLAGHQADLIATVFEPFVEGLPVDTG